MRRAALLVVVLTVAAVAGLAVAALTDQRSQAFTLGVAAGRALPLAPGQIACQAPLTVPAGAAFDGVTFSLGTEGKPGPRIDVSVRGLPRQEVLARGTLRGGYRDAAPVTKHTVWLRQTPAGSSIGVCLVNRGTRSVFVYGDSDAAARSSQGSIDGKAAGADLALSFQRRSPESVAALVPAMIDRAALFRARWVGPWTYVVLGLLVLLAVPALLVRALRAAAPPPPR